MKLVNLAQQGDGLVLGTQRVIGSDASVTNLIDLVTHSPPAPNGSTLATSKPTTSATRASTTRMPHCQR